VQDVPGDGRKPWWIAQKWQRGNRNKWRERSAIHSISDAVAIICLLSGRSTMEKGRWSWILIFPKKNNSPLISLAFLCQRLAYFSIKRKTVSHGSIMSNVLHQSRLFAFQCGKFKRRPISKKVLTYQSGWILNRAFLFWEAHRGNRREHKERKVLHFITSLNRARRFHHL